MRHIVDLIASLKKDPVTAVKAMERMLRIVQREGYAGLLVESAPEQSGQPRSANSSPHRHQSSETSTSKIFGSLISVMMSFIEAYARTSASGPPLAPSSGLRRPSFSEEGCNEKLAICILKAFALFAKEKVDNAKYIEQHGTLISILLRLLPSPSASKVKGEGLDNLKDFGIVHVSLKLLNALSVKVKRVIQAIRNEGGTARLFALLSALSTKGLAQKCPKLTKNTLDALTLLCQKSDMLPLTAKNGTVMQVLVIVQKVSPGSSVFSSAVHLVRALTKLHKILKQAIEVFKPRRYWFRDAAISYR